jgi:hypothetical protein
MGWSFAALKPPSGLSTKVFMPGFPPKAKQKNSWRMSCSSLVLRFNDRKPRIQYSRHQCRHLLLNLLCGQECSKDVRSAQSDSLAREVSDRARCRNKRGTLGRSHQFSVNLSSPLCPTYQADLANPIESLEER